MSAFGGSMQEPFLPGEAFQPTQNPIGGSQCVIAIVFSTMSLKRKISERGAWLDATAQHHRFDRALAAEIAEFLKGESASVLDMGCGQGEYVRLFSLDGIRAWGVDGNPHTSHYNGSCTTGDLSEPQDFEKSDWVMSLEVGEHIPQQWSSIFIDNLHRHNRNGIVLSWAVPGQKGHGHVNCRSNCEIEHIFSELGYVEERNLQDRFRRAAKLAWFKRTLMVFRKIDDVRVR
jgi:hypothetical protein